MSYREAELLRNRALRMLDSAKRSLASHDYDIAAFMADQSLQLSLKSRIFDLTGEIPRVHSVRQLLHFLGTTLGESDDVEDFIKKNRSLLIRLEDAYINSRYVPREYERDEVEELVKFAEEAVEFVKHLERKT